MALCWLLTGITLLSLSGFMLFNYPPFLFGITAGCWVLACLAERQFLKAGGDQGDRSPGARPGNEEARH